MIELSIVFGTYNRLEYLKRTLNSIDKKADWDDQNWEMIIVDGGSTDGTQELFKFQELAKDIHFIDQGELLGCVDAYNKAFTLARGDYVAFLNDDIEVIGTPLQDACKLLDENPKIGMVAIPYENPGSRRTVAYCKSGGQEFLYACFGVLRRELGERAGWFDGFYHYCGDCHLAMSIWKMGYKVVELTTGGYIKHYNAPSPVKNKAPELRAKVKNDWKLYAEKWGSWDGKVDG